MRASPRISILSEGGEPCTVGKRPSKYHKTVIFVWRWLPFHWWLLMWMSLTTVAERATDTVLLQQKTVSRGNQLVTENWDLPDPGSFRKSQSPVFCSLRQTCCSLPSHIAGSKLWVSNFSGRKNGSEAVRKTGCLLCPISSVGTKLIYI